jgi:hypothetical protein
MWRVGKRQILRCMQSPDMFCTLQEDDEDEDIQEPPTKARKQAKEAPTNGAESTGEMPPAAESEPVNGKGKGKGKGKRTAEDVIEKHKACALIPLTEFDQG